MNLIDAAHQLRLAMHPWPERAPVGPVHYILNPLDYAWTPYEIYCQRFAPEGHRVDAVLLGMNPGPWGMAQSGIPFGSPDFVRDFLKIDALVQGPSRQHPKRPILGLASERTEVSGQRIWGGIQRCFGTPEAFFSRFFVSNFCPLAFQSESGANLTPDKLPRGMWEALEPACDAHLRAVLVTLQPHVVIGVGKWAEEQARRVVTASRLPVRVATILHPSPASPQANRGWLEAARAQLDALGTPWPAPGLSTEHP